MSQFSEIAIRTYSINTRIMNYRQIEIFCTIIERNSITEAAEHLGLSQPAVSKSLKALEYHLNLKLFNRTTRGLHATDEARELYTEAQRAMYGFAQFETFARNIQKLEHARLIVGVMGALSLTWLSRIVVNFSIEYPDVSLVLRALASATIIKAVAQGELDVGVGQVQTDDPAVSKRKLGDLHVMCAIHKDHGLAARDVITPTDLDKQLLVLLSAQDEFRRMLDGALLSKGVAIKSKIEASHSVMVCSLVGEGHGVGIVDSETASNGRWPNLVFRPFKPLIKTPIYLLRNIHSPQSLASKRFSDHVAKYRMN